MNRYLPFLLLITFFCLLMFLLDLRSKQIDDLTRTNAQEKIIKRAPTPTPYLFTEEGLWRVVNNWKFGNDGYYYKEDKKLCEYADQRILDIQKDFSHNKFLEMKKTDNFDRVAENLSKDYWGFESEVLQAWLRSTSHKKNLEENFTHSCIKCENSYCVQLFGKY